MSDNEWEDYGEFQIFDPESGTEDSLEDNHDSLMVKYEGTVYEVSKTNGDYDVEPFGGSYGSVKLVGNESEVKELLEKEKSSSVRVILND